MACSASLRLCGLTLRPGIERDTQLMPWVIADSVLEEASHFLKVELPAEWADWLDERAERCYAKHRQFRSLVQRKNETGRNYLFKFFRHWLASRLHRERRGLFRKLPRSFSLGVPLSRGSAIPGLTPLSCSRVNFSL